jgi:hypothetical protein
MTTQSAIIIGALIIATAINLSIENICKAIRSRS